MPRLSLCFFVIVAFSSVIPQSTMHPRPPGLTEGQQQINRPLEPPIEMRNRKINVEQVKQEAEELRKLADGVPAQIQQMTNNQLPKDLSDNLKRIEKLAKHLHTEVTP